MALTSAERDAVARDFTKQVYVSKTADVHFSDVRAAVDSIDDDMGGLASLLTQTKTVLANLADNIPAPCATKLSASEKSKLCGLVETKRSEQ